MGLIKAGEGTLGGVPADQRKEFSVAMHWIWIPLLAFNNVMCQISGLRL